MRGVAVNGSPGTTEVVAVALVERGTTRMRTGVNRAW
jgi:hypothetical protein